MLHCPTCGRHYENEVKVCPEDGAALQADATVQAAIPADPLIGVTFDGKYRLDERLGQGGMGTVYRATHLLIDRPVAIKVLNPRFVEDEEAQERFRREARAAGRLQHMNAVAVTDFGRTEDGFVYIVMELLIGRSLRDVLAREAPLDGARAVSLMLQVSAAVSAAHEAGIIHRDLKPGNIFVVQRKHAPPIVKVLDFGIAKLAADAFDDDDPVTLTQVGVMIGTPRYMSPEQCDSRRLTPASDVYSLGIILYEMLTGTTPFTGSTPLAVAMRHSVEIPRPPREFVGSIPVELEEVVLHALEKNADNRPANAGEFRQELYATAERLGFEHAGVRSAPTMETVRNTGTETPSGRLVVDIARLREKRAAITSGEALLSASAEEKLKSGEAAAADPSPATAALIHTTEPTLVAPAGSLQEEKADWLKWLKQPVVLMYAGLSALVLLIVIFITLAMRSPGAYVSPVNHSAIAVESPTESPASAAVGEASSSANPSVSPSPDPTSTVEAGEKGTRNGSGRQHARDTRRSRRQASVPAKPNKPSKVGRFFGKIKRTFKKPF